MVRQAPWASVRIQDLVLQGRSGLWKMCEQHGVKNKTTNQTMWEEPWKCHSYVGKNSEIKEGIQLGTTIKVPRNVLS